MRLSVSSRLALATVVAVPLIGCGAQSATPDPGGVGNKPVDLISDFEEGRAVVLPLGDPPRSGYWYAYNDGTCLQSPTNSDRFYASTPAAVAPGTSGGRALHGSWMRCAAWGAGVGADFNGPILDGTVSAAPRTPYNLQPFAGVTFLAMAMPGTDGHLRAKLVMRASTQIPEGGTCDEAILGADRCGDEWNEPFTLPGDGTWKAVTVRFSDSTFKQEGWGQPFAWNPADVLGIQFQSVDLTGLYDFWIDDVMLVR
jgi:hypothetical protein